MSISAATTTTTTTTTSPINMNDAEHEAEHKSRLPLFSISDANMDEEVALPPPCLYKPRKKADPTGVYSLKSNKFKLKKANQWSQNQNNILDDLADADKVCGFEAMQDTNHCSDNIKLSKNQHNHHQAIISSASMPCLSSMNDISNDPYSNIVSRSSNKTEDIIHSIFLENFMALNSRDVGNYNTRLSFFK